MLQKEDLSGAVRSCLDQQSASSSGLVMLDPEVPTYAHVCMLALSLSLHHPENDPTCVI